MKDSKGMDLDVVSLYQKNIDYYNNLAGEKPKYDLLKLYFGEDYKINDKITIHQPTIQNILDMGEENFYATIAPFTSNTTSLRVQLYDLGIYWNDITDFELFSLLIKTLDFNNTKIFFGDFDITSFDLKVKLDSNNIEKLILFSEKIDYEIDEETYLKIRDYFCFMFNVKLENEIVKSKSLGAEIIAKERADMAKKRAELKGTTSLIQMISFALNHPGFKYKKNELRNIGYVEFMDSIKRLQVYESTKALTHGSYSGFCDVSKVPKEEFNFMRNVNI